MKRCRPPPFPNGLDDRARDPRGQQAETNAAVAVLNRKLSAGRPNSVRTSAAAV